MSKKRDLRIYQTAILSNSSQSAKLPKNHNFVPHLSHPPKRLQAILKDLQKIDFNCLIIIILSRNSTAGFHLYFYI